MTSAPDSNLYYTGIYARGSSNEVYGSTQNGVGVYGDGQHGIGVGAISFLIADHHVAAIWTFYAVIVLAIVAIGAYVQRHLWETESKAEIASGLNLLVPCRGAFLRRPGVFFGPRR